MIGDGEGTRGQVFRTGQHLREGGDQRVVGADAGEERRHFFAAAEAFDQQRALDVPAPTGLKLPTGDAGLYQHVAHTGWRQVGEDLVQWEAGGGRERQQQRFFRCRRFQFEAEATTEAFAQRQPPRAVDARTERRMDDQLHATAVVEEAFGDHQRRRRDRSERGLAGCEVVLQLFGAARVESVRSAPAWAVAVLAHVPDGTRQFTRTPGRFTEPEGNGRRRTGRVGDPHHTGRARLAARRRRFTPSWCSSARRPSVCSATTASKSARVNSRYGQARRRQA